MSSDACANCGKTGGVLKGCTRCRLVSYCNQGCQRIHWINGGHKAVCVGPGMAQKTPKLTNDQLEALFGEGMTRLKDLKYKHGGQMPDILSMDASDRREADKIVNRISRAAEGGIVSAEYNLGCLYLKGAMVPRNDKLAHKWLMVASQNPARDETTNRLVNSALTEFARGIVILLVKKYKATGGSADFEPSESLKAELACECLTTAAKDGYVDAQYILGLVLFDGLCVEPKLLDAIQWFTSAAENGFFLAQRRLVYVYADKEKKHHNDELAAKWVALALRNKECAASERPALLLLQASIGDRLARRPVPLPAVAEVKEQAEVETCDHSLVGKRVQVQGLQTALHYNGQVGIVMSVESSTGRWPVKLEGSNKVLSILFENFAEFRESGVIADSAIVSISAVSGSVTSSDSEDNQEFCPATDDLAQQTYISELPKVVLAQDCLSRLRVLPSNIQPNSLIAPGNCGSVTEVDLGEECGASADIVASGEGGLNANCITDDPIVDASQATFCDLETKCAIAHEVSPDVFVPQGTDAELFPPKTLGGSITRATITGTLLLGLDGPTEPESQMLVPEHAHAFTLVQEAKVLLSKHERKVDAKGATWAEISKTSHGKRDLNRIEKLLRDATKLNYSEAEFELGRLMNGGYWIKANLADALNLLSKAASKGYSKAWSTMERICRGQKGALQTLNDVGVNFSKADNFFDAKRCFEHGAELGCSIAKKNLGSIQEYINSDILEIATSRLKAAHEAGDFKTIDEAFAQIQHLANAGHIQSNLKLGVILMRGSYGQSINKPKAIEYISVAAEGGMVAAQHFVGDWFAKDAPTIDMAAATRWYTLAAKRGHKGAQKSLSKIFVRQGEYLQASIWLKKLSDTGDHEASLNLGNMYISGQLKNGNPEPKRALQFYQDAAASPNKEVADLARVKISRVMVDFPETISVEPVIPTAVAAKIAGEVISLVPVSPIKTPVRGRAFKAESTETHDTPTAGLLPVDTFPEDIDVLVRMVEGGSASTKNGKVNKVKRKVIALAGPAGPEKQSNFSGSKRAEAFHVVRQSEVADSLSLPEAAKEHCTRNQEFFDAAVTELSPEITCKCSSSDNEGCSTNKFGIVMREYASPVDTTSIIDRPDSSAVYTVDADAFEVSSADRLRCISPLEQHFVLAGTEDTAIQKPPVMPEEGDCKPLSFEEIAEISSANHAALTVQSDAEAHAFIEALVAESRAAEASRVLEDDIAEEIVFNFCSALRAEGIGYEGIWNPPRDGDCLLRCAIEHDFGVYEAKKTDREWLTAATSSGRKKKAGAVAEKHVAVSKPLTADSLRLAVVARVRETSLPELKEEAVAEFENRCSVMARPGVVMGEDELQALADVRGAVVQVRSVICVKESSDFGATLPPRIYRPKLYGGGVGRGDTLVLLQEVRAHRMSHFQLLRLPLRSPPPGSDVNVCAEEVE